MKAPTKTTEESPLLRTITSTFNYSSRRQSTVCLSLVVILIFLYCIVALLFYNIGVLLKISDFSHFISLFKATWSFSMFLSKTPLSLLYMVIVVFLGRAIWYQSFFPYDSCHTFLTSILSFQGILKAKGSSNGKAPKNHMLKTKSGHDKSSSYA